MARIFDRELNDYRELTPEEEARFEAERPVLTFPDTLPKQYSKVQMFKIMTDAEYEKFEQVEAQQPKRLRRVFEAASVLDEGDELFGMFEQLVLGSYGEKRGRELLAAAEIK